MANKQSPLHFDEQTHTYTLGGKTVPSVTEIVGILTAKSMSALPPMMLDNAARRGTRVHEVCELIDYGIPLEDIGIEPDIVGYVTAYLKFKRDYRPQWQLIEQPVFNAVLGYAGRLDRFGTIDGKETIVDIKTTASSNKLNKISWSVQTEGYKYAIRKLDAGRMIVQLKPNGNYTAYNCDDIDSKWHIDSLETFITCTKLTYMIGDYKWKKP